MPNIPCPHCGKNNSPKRETCKYCGLDLRPAIPLGMAYSHPVADGEEYSDESPPTTATNAIRENAGEAGPGAAVGLNTRQSSTMKATNSQDDNQPDLLAGLERISSDEEQTPEWFAALVRDENESTAPAVTKEAELFKKETPVPPAEKETPEWVKSLQAPLEDEKKPSPKKDVEGDLPDWLKVSPDFGEKESKKPVQEKPADSLDISPDRVENIKNGKGSEEGSEIPHWKTESGEVIDKEKENDLASLSPDSSSAPDWLGTLGRDISASEPLEKGESPDSVPDQMPDYGAAPDTTGSSPGENVPNWFSEIGAEPSVGSSSSSAFFNSEALSDQLDNGEMPDWLIDMQAEMNGNPPQEEREPGPKGIVGKSESDEGDRDKSDFTAPSKTPALLDDAPSTGEQAFSIEMPEWLAKLRPENTEENPDSTIEEIPASGEVATPSLPSWVQAMRPVEAVVMDQTNRFEAGPNTVEQAGPLAGLSGIIPVEPGLGQLKKPPAYSVKLQLSEAQQKFAAYLEHMISEETQPRKVDSGRGRINRIWRWSIAAILILALGIPLVTGAKFTLGPSSPSTDGNSSRLIIETIPPGSPVLVAFDYEPALSGEMEALAAPLIDQLQQKGTILSLISLSPSGTGLAERFIHSTPLVNTNLYQKGIQYVNLGYLAGGLSGIYAFASDPQKAAPFDVSGSPAWHSTALQGIHSIGDFNAVVIITDNGDTARNWIEQAGWQKGNIPFLMVLSAQAGPLVRPYFESGQVNGMVIGLVDAKIYEQNYGRPGLADYFWSSYSLGIVVAVGLMAVGALVSLMMSFQAGRKTMGGNI